MSISLHLRIPAVQAEVRHAVSDGLEKAAQDVVEEAKRLVPVRTGHLRESITSKADGLNVEIIAEADYAIFVEMGTHTDPAQPYLRPALAKMGPKIIGRVTNS